MYNIRLSLKKTFFHSATGSGQFGGKGRTLLLGRYFTFRPVRRSGLLSTSDAENLHLFDGEFGFGIERDLRHIQSDQTMARWTSQSNGRMTSDVRKQKFRIVFETFTHGSS